MDKIDQQSNQKNYIWKFLKKMLWMLTSGKQTEILLQMSTFIITINISYISYIRMDTQQ